MDADGDAVVRLVAANLADELQDGVNGRGDVVVRPVFIVELVDGADFLQEEKSVGRVWGHRGDAAAAPAGTDQDVGPAKGSRRATDISSSHPRRWAKVRGAVCSCKSSVAIL